jgi:hypothetical protein
MRNLSSHGGMPERKRRNTVCRTRTRGTPRGDGPLNPKYEALNPKPRTRGTPRGDGPFNPEYEALNPKPLGP